MISFENEIYIISCADRYGPGVLAVKTNEPIVHVTRGIILHKEELYQITVLYFLHDVDPAASESMVHKEYRTQGVSELLGYDSVVDHQVVLCTCSGEC